MTCFMSLLTKALATSVERCLDRLLDKKPDAQGRYQGHGPDDAEGHGLDLGNLDLRESRSHVVEPFDRLVAESRGRGVLGFILGLCGLAAARVRPLGAT